MGTTTNYSWTYPTVNADADAWGTILNNLAIAIDAQMFTNAGLAAPKANPTFTGTTTVATLSASGTATFADSGTWGSGGISGLTKLGLGMTPTNILDITQTQNGSSVVALKNASTGASADAHISVINSSSTGYFLVTSTGFTPNGAETADTLWISSNGGGGTAIGTHGAARPLIFFINNTEKARVGTDGSFLVGSTTNAGAGAIAATGNITAFYSDDRLKTRQGNIDGALAKVLSLQGFYYGPNETARELGYDYEREVGISAQDVQKVMPEVIAPAPIDPQYMTVRYDRLIPLLIEAIKELDAKKANA